ncbi:aminotransferase class V-fold PLP-dependent enzyme [Acaryochloris sp. 'Moss Beach']|uniref:cysteine desulfurase family protein n=1 Tax=Acaryochloris sp. 'Moss Beach' TaxID=2740837 RepID=UPI0028F3F0A8|nr:aminotransferase class V-fold PLP-dependent enzyme [Acaryochloris sp. 'Moss Beach']UJB71356.1 aminotransferase class V-fold PLP-dependent enzyme [Acaryochloris sp. 'Moss Beach']
MMPSLPERPIYLDCQATTPVDPRVVEAMLPYFTDCPGNPSSNNHLYGWEAKAAVDLARETIAQAIGAEPKEIVFTSGATEANNLAIKGIAEVYLSKGRHLITMQTEHNAVLEPCKYLEKLGFEVTYLLPQPDGLLDMECLEQAIRADTILVSVMAANNEIGVLQPIAEIGHMCRHHDVLFHTDAAQAIGKIPLDVEAMQIDLLSITGHKLYGPKGVGALYVRSRHPHVQVAAQLQGGGQERNVRSGTLPTPQIIGLGKAIELGLAEQATEAERLTELRTHLWKMLQVLDGIHLNGHPQQRLPGCLSVSFAGVDGATLLLGVQPYVALSSGSACASSKPSPSHVLTALGMSSQLSKATLRFGLGRFTTLEDVEQAAHHVIEAIQQCKHQ